jgi:hypothetical protein
VTSLGQADVVNEYETRRTRLFCQYESKQLMSKSTVDVTNDVGLTDGALCRFAR